MRNIFKVERYNFGGQTDRQTARNENNFNFKIFCQFRPLSEPLIGRYRLASFLSKNEECLISVRGHNWHQSSWA